MFAAEIVAVLLSLIAAIAASAVALVVVSRPRMGVKRALFGSVLMGGGIAPMHWEPGL